MRRAPESEAGFMAAVRELAAMTGWLCYHTHDSRRSEAGFPDLALVRRGRLVFAELKKDGEEPTPKQREWLSALGACAVPSVRGERCGLEVYVWKPSDWPSIEAVLAR